MILVFGGTTEGRKAAQTIDQAGKPFYYSTKGGLQEVNLLHGIRVSGAMDAATMRTFCREKGIRLLVDAAHPFAGQLRQTLAGVSEELQIPVVRYERLYPQRDPAAVWCKDFPDALDQLRKENVTRLLALTGVQTIGKLKPFWQQTDTWFRILDREESIAIAIDQGFPKEKLLFYQAGSDDSQLIRNLRPDAVILKESGTSGGFTGKINAARENNLRIFVVQHPPVPGEFHQVDGTHGLRRAIEQLLPGFYPLRTGITTGSCATAAAVAALTCLLTGKEQKNSIITLPNGEHLSIPVAGTVIKGNSVSCTVIKDAGDDADVTNGIPVIANVRLSPLLTESSFKRQIHSVTLLGGEGIGKVTLPGLGLETGSPAINAAPRKMIVENLQATYRTVESGTPCDLEVRLSVPGGEEVAKRTFNPRLGVIGGISIIGTSGIIQPFSTEAFISSIRKSMEVARASGSSRVVVNSGAKSEKYLRAHYANLPDTAFVHYGNYIGETLKIASELDIRQVILGIMIGKAVKLAEGHLDTHSKKITMNREFLRQTAREAGCGGETIRNIGHVTLARELWDIIPPGEHDAFFGKLTDLCYRHCTPLLPKGQLTILLVGENGKIM